MYTWLVLFLGLFSRAGPQLPTFSPVPTRKHFACLSCCQTLNWIMAVCHLSLAGKAVKCQTRSSRHEVLYSAGCCHLLLSAGSCRERTFVWPFLYCHVPAMESQLTVWFYLFFHYWCIHSVWYKQKYSRSKPGSDMLVLVPCPLVLISSCPCCHWATNGTSLEAQHQGISESLMTHVQKWIFLAEETKQAWF